MKRNSALILTMFLGIALMISGCAAPSRPTAQNGPRPIYDEEGRPLWVPPSGSRPSPHTLPPSGEQGTVSAENGGGENNAPFPGNEGAPAEKPAESGPPRIGGGWEAPSDQKDDYLVAAVSPLEARAERELEAGQLDRAFSTAERAVRIDPENARVWNLMARIRFKQKDYSQAEHLARKSDLLAGNDRQLRSVNWKIIATVLSYRGDEDGARKALQKAEALAAGRGGT